MAPRPPISAALATPERAAASVRWILAALSLSMLLPSLGTSIANVGLPALARAFGASFAEVQWVVLAYLLASTTLIVSVGRLGDIVGRRRLLLAGIALFTVASVLCGAASTLPVLIAARAVQGLGAAVMMALTLAFVGETVPKAQTGRAMGLLGTMSAAGTALGPSLGGVLVDALGWPALFLVNLPLGVVTFVLAFRHLPVDRRVSQTEERPRFDPVGTVLLALTLAAYALAATVGRRGGFGALGVALLLGAGCGLGLFVLAEKRAASPLIRLAMFRDSRLTASLVKSALVSTVMMATMVVGPFHLSRGLGLDAMVVGLLLSVGPLVAAVTGVLAGRIVDRYGAARTTMVGLVGMAAGCCLVATMPAALGVAGYVGPVAVVTVGYSLFQTANNTAVMAHVRADQRGVVSGLLNLSRNLGLVTGASVMGAVFALGAATSDVATAPPEAVTTGMRVTFVVAAVLIAFALAVTSERRGRAGWRAPPGCSLRPPAAAGEEQQQRAPGGEDVAPPIEEVEATDSRALAALRLAGRAARGGDTRVEGLQRGGASGVRLVAAGTARLIVRARGVAALEGETRGIRAARERLRAAARVDAGLACRRRRGVAALARRARDDDDIAATATAAATVRRVGSIAGRQAVDAAAGDTRRREPALRARAAIAAGRCAVGGTRAHVAGGVRAAQERRRRRAQARRRLIRGVVARARGHGAAERSASASGVSVRSVPGAARVEPAAGREEHDGPSRHRDARRRALRAHAARVWLSRRDGRCRTRKTKGWPRTWRGQPSSERSELSPRELGGSRGS